MKLSIVVTHYKTPELLKLCLRSVKEAVRDFSSEIIVVDSESQDETEEMIKNEFPEIQFIAFKKNTAFSKLVNAGLAKADGNYIAILNADLILPPDSLKKLVDYMNQNPKAGLVGPQLLNFNGTVQESCFRFYRPLTVLYRRTFLGKTKAGRRELERFSMKDFDHQSTRQVDWLLGAALLVRREALDAVGLMDERFFLYFEDVDWCWRFAKAGFKVVYCPEAKMHHYHGKVSKKSGGLAEVFFNKYTWIHIFSGIKFFLKHRGN